MPVPVILANWPACTTSYIQSNRPLAPVSLLLPHPHREIRRIARIMPVKSSDFRKSICLFAFCLGVVTYPKEPEREFSESGNSSDTECNWWHIVGTFDRSRHMTTVFYLEHSLSQVVAVLFRTSDFSRDKWARLCFPLRERTFFLPNTLAVVGVSPHLMQGASIWPTSRIKKPLSTIYYVGTGSVVMSKTYSPFSSTLLAFPQRQAIFDFVHFHFKKSTIHNGGYKQQHKWQR
jgi:hypothetical protein